MWRICGGAVIGKKVNRQGNLKTSSEVNDISLAFNALAEANRIPTFICTSEMVALTPFYNSHPSDGDTVVINERLRVIEETLNSVLKYSEKPLSTDVNCVHHDKIIFKLNEIDQSINSLDKCSTTNKNEENFPQENIIANSNLSDMENSEIEDDPDSDNGGWESVFYKKNRKKGKTDRSWRSQLTSIRGTARSDNDGNIAADIHLVAFGVSKHVSGIHLSKFLEEKGLKIVSCELLTRHESARSLSYKITIKPGDLAKAQDPKT